MSRQALVVMLCGLLNIRSLITTGLFLVGILVWSKGAETNGWVLGGAIGLLFVQSILRPIVRYFSLRYWVEGGLLHLAHGWLSKHKLTIPLSRIHSLSTESNMWYQATDMVGLKIDTKATEGVELELILTQAEYDTLYQVIAQEERIYLEHTPQEEATPPLEEPSSQPSGMEAVDIASPSAVEPKIISYQLWDLIRAGLTGNHIKGIWLIAYVVYKGFEEIRSLFPESTITRQIIQYSKSLGHSPQVMQWVEDGIAIAIGLFVVLLASAVIQTGIYVWQYWQAEVEISPKRIVLSRGLSTRIKQVIRRKQAVSISLKTNILESLVGTKTLQVDLARSSLSDKDESNKFRLRGWQDEASILDWWQVSPREIQRGLRSRWYIWRLHLLIGLAGALALGAFVAWLTYRGELTWHWQLLSTLPLVLCGGYGWSLYRHGSVRLTARHLHITQGGWARQETWIPYESVGMISLRQAIWQRGTGTCSLEISTLGSTYRIPALGRGEASELRNVLLYIIEV